MTKRRAIISFEKLTSEQKKKLELDFPEGYLGSLTTIKTPTGEMLDALIWETDEMIYLVKINKAAFTVALDEEDDDFEEEDDLDADILVGEEDDDVENEAEEEEESEEEE